MANFQGTRRLPIGWWGKCAIAGMVGGVAFALYEMGTLMDMGMGPWLHLNAIAAIFPAFSPPTWDFVPAATLTGVVLHLITAAVWGVLYGGFSFAYFSHWSRTWSGQIILGLGWGLLTWLVMGTLIGYLINPALQVLPVFHYLMGQLIFGLVTALVLYAWTRKRELRVTFAPAATVQEEAAVREERS